MFYSFHFDNDVMRVQLIRQMGKIDGDEPVTTTEWEQLKRKDRGVEKWINEKIATCSCVVVLVGEDTANRPWVRYEIEKAWNDGKAVVGIYIHNLKCANKVKLGLSGTCNKGDNPFDRLTFTSGTNEGKKLSEFVACHDPGYAAYATIAECIEGWIEDAIASRKSP